METTKRKRFNKNTFNLGEPLSKRTRLRIYKEALQYLKDGRGSNNNEPSGLCLILPFLLFKLNNYRDNQPNGNIWTYKDTDKSFPEIKLFLDKYSFNNRTDETRIKFLEETIEQLS